MTIESPQLGAPAHEVIHVEATYLWPHGWVLRFVSRRSGSSDWEQDRYDELDLFELHQVVSDVLALKLGI